MYKIEIKTTSRELTAKERIQLRSTNDMILLSDLESDTQIKPQWYAIIHVTNDKAKDTEYDNIVISDGETMYYTGSSSFMEEFPAIFEEMATSGEEWAFKVKQVESKQYKGKYFLRCSVI